MKYTYIPKGVCSRKISIELDKDKILNVEFEGGCNGNTKGIAAMIRGQNVNDVIERLKGIQCQSKGTSCPDQLALALEQALKESE